MQRIRKARRFYLAKDMRTRGLRPLEIRGANFEEGRNRGKLKFESLILAQDERWRRA